MANNENFPNVFEALDKALGEYKTENLLLRYRVEDLERKLAEAEASKKNESEVA